MPRINTGHLEHAANEARSESFVNGFINIPSVVIFPLKAGATNVRSARGMNAIETCVMTAMANQKGFKDIVGVSRASCIAYGILNM